MDNYTFELLPMEITGWMILRADQAQFIMLDKLYGIDQLVERVSELIYQ